MTNSIKKDTGKFWSFKHTINHRSLKKIDNAKVVRTFTFKKSFLLLVINSETGLEEYVIPHRFISQNWPRGYYSTKTSEKIITFTDQDIISVIE